MRLLFLFCRNPLFYKISLFPLEISFFLCYNESLIRIDNFSKERYMIMVKKVISVCLVLAFVLSVCVIPSHAVDYSYLQAVLDAWDNFDTTGIPSYAIDNAQYEYEAAREYLGSRNQNDIDAAADSFAGFLMNFGIFVEPPEPAQIDYSELESALNDVYANYLNDDVVNENSGKYTSESWSELVSAYNEANAVYRNKDAEDQDQVDQLKDALVSAVSNLVEPTVELGLNEMLAQYKSIYESGNKNPQTYTTVSYDMFWQSYDTALYMMDPLAQEEMGDYFAEMLDWCTEDLRQQYAALVPVVYATETEMVSAPVAGGEAGSFAQNTYFIDEVYNNNYELTSKKVIAQSDTVSVTFEQLFLRTMVQYKEENGSYDIRFVTMLDKNLENYKKAGFVYTINGEDVELYTTDAYESFITDGETVNFSDYNPCEGCFVLQNVVFDAAVAAGLGTIEVKPFVELTDGTTLYGSSVAFSFNDFDN